MIIDLDDFLNIADFARHINRTQQWVCILIEKGNLPTISHNGRRLIPKSGVLPEYLKEETQKKLKTVMKGH